MKKILVSFIFILSISGVIASNGYEVTFDQSNASTYSLNFNIFDFHLGEVTYDGVTYSKINFDGSVKTEKKGYAELPYVHASLMISPDKNVTLEVVGVEYVDYPLDYSLLPSRGVIYRNQNPDEIPYEIDPQSIVDGWYPANVAENAEPFIIKDFRGTSVYVYPFQYNAKKNILRFYTNVKVQVIENDEQPIVNPLMKITDQVLYEMEPVYRSVFINYPQNRDDLTIGEIGDILVICTDRDSEAIDPYIEWKIQKGIGVYKEVVATGTTVKSLIQEKYDDNNNILYVLLVGDWADIKSETLGSAPMDPQLGCVVGTDVYADICIGRFSANNPEHVTTQVNKVIGYERDPEAGAEWYANAIGIASTQGPGDDNETDNAHNNVIWENKLEPFTYQNFTPIYDPSANTTMVFNAVEEGATVINYTGHGSPTSWGSSGFSNSHVAQLENGEKLPFIVSVACNNGDFHTGECFAEAWTKKADGGAIVFVGASISQPWDPPMRGQDYFMDVLIGGYDYTQYPGQSGITTTEGRSTVGSFLFNGLTLMIVESSGSSDLETAKTWNTFGDPSLQLRTATPIEITINNNVILVGVPFESNVTASGQPVAGALVAISKDGICFSAVTDENGFVSIENTFEPGDAKLVVTGQNILTIIEDATIIPPDGPYLVQNECIVIDETGNGNGQADFGEDITLDISLKNVGISPANNVTATLTSTDEFATITSNEYTYGTIAAGTLIGGSDFGITIAGNVPDMHTVEFGLEMSDDSDNIWNSVSYVTVNAPVPSVSMNQIDDSQGNGNGRLDPGETADLIFKIWNYGHATSPEGEIEISSTSFFVTLNSSSATTEAIEPGMYSMVSFNVTIDETTPLASIIDFTINYVTGDYSYENELNLVVGLIMEDWETLSFNNYNWEFSGDAEWFISEVNPFEGSYCAQSGSINDNQESELLITLEVLSDDTISFYRKVSSEASYDYLQFFIDDDKVEEWAGVMPWSEKKYPITAGVHTLKWKYMKDVGVSTGSDCAWIDYIIFPPIALYVGVDDNTRNLNQVSIYPNPFKDQLHISYSVAESNVVKLSVFNALGQQVNIVEQGVQAPGKYMLDMNSSNLDKGMYYYRLEIGEEIHTGKLIRSE